MFIRRAKLIISGNREIQGGGSGVTLESDGSLEAGLQIAFNVKKTMLGAPNQAVISVYNLSPESRNIVRTRGLDVQLFVGWKDTPLYLLMSGATQNAVPSRESTDIRTDIYVLDGGDAMSIASLRKTYGALTPVSEIVTDLANTLEGISIGEINVRGTVGDRGITVEGTTSSILDKLARQYFFSWSIQDQIFQAIMDDTSSGKVHLISATNTDKGTLIQAAPMLSGPMQRRSGISVDAIMDPTIKPGQKIQLNSTVVSYLNGEYKVHNIDFSGDTFGGDYVMSIESLREF